MKKYVIRLLQLFIVTAGVLSCTGANLYTDLASNKESDEALFEDAQTLLDDGDYTGAINKLLATTADFQASARVKESLAGAYAARCGMEFLPFINNLTGGSSSSLFTLAMNGFVGVDTSNYADCKTAKTIIKSIGNVSERTTSQNLFLSVLGLAMLGNRIRANADISPTATGDGTVDASYNCGPTQMPIADAAEVIESFALILENIAALGSVAAGAASDLEDVADLCGDDCTEITYAGASPAESDAAIIMSRAIINMQSIGVGSCNDPDPSNCACLFP